MYITINNHIECKQTPSTSHQHIMQGIPSLKNRGVQYLWGQSTKFQTNNIIHFERTHYPQNILIEIKLIIDILCIYECLKSCITDVGMFKITKKFKILY